MSENRQPKGIPTGGQFAASAHGEAAVDLNTGFFPPAPLSPRDVETLTEHQGVFEYGYDADDVNRVLGQFEGAQLVCVWDSFDDIGYGGDSEFVGVALVPDGQTSPYKRADGSTIEHRVSKGSWRRIHPQVWEYLSDSDCDVDPAAIPSLLDDEVFDGPEVDELLGDGRCNLAANADGDL